MITALALKRSFISLAAAASLAGCGAMDEPIDEQTLALGYDPGVNVHLMLKTPDKPEAEAIKPAAAAHLQYFGGRVVSNAQIVTVLYGSGHYLSNITSNTAPSLPSFFQQVLNSAYVDWLTEYNTTISGGTNQHIGRGSHLARVQITPAASRNHATITDAQIQAEISSQISKGVLPAPTANTIYMTYFPQGKTINSGGELSCQVFCAYHGTFKRGNTEVYYGVMPDMSPGSNCDTGCGGSSSQFNNQTSVSSHEMTETITDAEVGLATVVGKPLAWYDPTNGEIGDICNAEQGTIHGSDGHTYTVQKEWSNQKGNCIVHK
jgi:hypothetical protein